MNNSSLSERDKQHLWHPLTQHKTHGETIAITKAENCVLTDEQGNEYIDAIASWYTCMYGHCNSYITSKVYAQMQRLDQVVFTGFTHQPAVALSEALMAILPQNQQKLFFSDNGSTTVDIAIKMALQYHANTGQKRTTLIAFEDGFHGDTFGAMSVSGLSVYNGPFEEFFLEVKRIPTPTEDTITEVLAELTTLSKEYQIAAFVYEPLVQGAAAMKMHCGVYLDPILAFCKANGILTIADEVMTGFGKTGKHFASLYMEVQPDIMCLSKALTAGLVPMGITSCTQEVYNAFYSSELEKGFFHGHTYSANPIACTAALAGIELLQSPAIQTQISTIQKQHQAFVEHIKTHAKVKAVRQLGVILAIDINAEANRYGGLRDRLFKFYLSKGVYLRPLGNTVYILAPYTISEAQLEKVYKTIEDSLAIV